MAGATHHGTASLKVRIELRPTTKAMYILFGECFALLRRQVTLQIPNINLLRGVGTQIVYLFLLIEVWVC